jgi:hypothetical protein
MSENTAALLDRLRGQIRKLEAQPRALLMALRTGVEEVDALGVFRLGAGVELCGEEASGRTTLALSVVAAACRQKRLAAWVDGPQELYPPAAVSLGVELERLLIVRPKAPGQLVWSAVQLLRSGAFSCVVLDVMHTGVVPSLTDTKKLLDAARAGGSLLVLVTSQAAPAQGLVRLMLRQHREGARGAAGGHLRCVEGGRGPSEGPGGAEPGSSRAPPREDFTFLIESPHGRRTQLPRARLVREGVPVRRARTIGAAAAPLRVVPAESFARPRKNFDRDGYGLLGQGRPGREGPIALPAPLRTARSWQ